jgi:hypothetical protein
MPKDRIHHLQNIAIKYLQRVAVSSADLAKEKKEVAFVRKIKHVGKYPPFKNT